MGGESVGASELTRDAALRSRRHHSWRTCRAGGVRNVATAWTAVWAVTAAAALLGWSVPALTPGAAPHPALHGTISDFTAIVVINLRVLCAPFLLTAFRFPTGRRSRALGDLVVVGLLAGNALRVGLALGRDGVDLLPYVPQLPLEWLAAAVAGGAWLTLRRHPKARTAAEYASVVLALVVVSAAVETLATPHVAEHRRADRGLAIVGREPASIGPATVRQAGGDLPAPDRAPAPALASRSLRSLPLAVARFRSAVWPALPGYVNHPRIPQRREPEDEFSVSHSKAGR